MRRVVFVFSFSFFLAWAPRAQAQPSAPSATELAEQAKRAHDLGRLDDAIDAYARAYQISGESHLLFSMAEVHREAGHSVDALRVFQNYLRRDPKGVHREAAEKHIKELERQSRRGASEGKSTTPPPASVKPSPGMPVAPPRPAGTEKRAAPPVVVAVPPTPPGRQLSAAPSPPPPPARQAPAAPSPAVAPPRSVVPLQVTSPPPPSLAAPSPSVGTAAPVAAVDLVAAPPPSSGATAQPPLPRWVPWTLAAVTVALGTGAMVSGLSASHRYDELQNSCGLTTDGCAADQIDDVKSRARRANILWVLTSVAAVGTGVTVYVNAHAAGMSGLWAF